MDKSWINAVFSEGQFSRQAHCDLPADSFEREMGKEGFYGPVTHFYHRHAPTGWCDFEGALRPRAYDFTKLDGFSASPLSARVLLSNPHCSVRFWRLDPAEKSSLFRNADGDDLLFVHQGAGSLFCDFGHLEFTDGDYLLLPRGTMWRLEADAPVELLMIEATNDSYKLPDKGMLGPNAIFDPALFDTPAINDKFLGQQSDDRTILTVKCANLPSTITYPFNPLDALGWKGSLAVLRVNWRDIRPVMSHRYHLPPSAHTSFVSSRFVVCTFCPRPIETDPGALKVPFYHNNDDYDELIFYHRGEFFSRDNIRPGMVTFHPAGFTHGPHPGAAKAGAKASRNATDEVAVMVDARDPLQPSEAAVAVEWEAYVKSWGGYGGAQ